MPPIDEEPSFLKVHSAKKPRTEFIVEAQMEDVGDVKPTNN